MGQSVITNAESLCDFLWGLPAMGYQVGQKPQQAGPHVTHVLCEVHSDQVHDFLSSTQPKN